MSADFLQDLVYSCMGKSQCENNVFVSGKTLHVHICAKGQNCAKTDTLREDTSQVTDQ